MIIIKIFRYSPTILYFYLKLLFLKILNKKYFVVDYDKNKNGNFGDDLNQYLYRRVFENFYIIKFPSFLRKSRNLFIPYRIIFVGSILRYNLNKSIIIGAGIIKDNEKVWGKPKVIFSLRGPLTRNILFKNDIDSPKLYGDLGLIMPLIYKPKSTTKKIKIGIIPHYIDQNLKTTNSVINKFNLHFIDITSNVEKFIDTINQCDYVLSSSLHGLIVSDAYNIPNRWVKLSSNVVGDGFKFKDYFMSVNRFDTEPIGLSFINNKNDLINILQDYQPIDFNIENYYNDFLRILEQIKNRKIY